MQPPPQNARARLISLSTSSIRLLPLDLVHKVKIALIKMMHPHIAILATTRVAPPLRIHSNRIQRPEVSFDSTDFVLEDLVVEARFELALARRSGRHVHGCLAAAEDDKVFLGRDGGGVERGVGDVFFEDFELTGGDKLGPLA